MSELDRNDFVSNSLGIDSFRWERKFVWLLENHRRTRCRSWSSSSYGVAVTEKRISFLRGNSSYRETKSWIKSWNSTSSFRKLHSHRSLSCDEISLVVDSSCAIMSHRRRSMCRESPMNLEWWRFYDIVSRYKRSFRNYLLSCRYFFCSKSPINLVTFHNKKRSLRILKITWTTSAFSFTWRRGRKSFVQFYYAARCRGGASPKGWMKWTHSEGKRMSSGRRKKT